MVLQTISSWFLPVLCYPVSRANKCKTVNSAHQHVLRYWKAEVNWLMWFWPRGKYNGQPRGGSKPLRYVPLKELEREADKGGAKEGRLEAAGRERISGIICRRKNASTTILLQKLPAKPTRRLYSLSRDIISVAKSDQVVNVTFLTCPLDLSSLCDIYWPSYFLNFHIQVVCSMLFSTELLISPVLLTDLGVSVTSQVDWSLLKVT